MKSMFNIGMAIVESAYMPRKNFLPNLFERAKKLCENQSWGGALTLLKIINKTYQAEVDSKAIDITQVRLFICYAHAANKDISEINETQELKSSFHHYKRNLSIITTQQMDVIIKELDAQTTSTLTALKNKLYLQDAKAIPTTTPNDALTYARKSIKNGDFLKAAEIYGDLLKTDLTNYQYRAGRCHALICLENQSLKFWHDEYILAWNSRDEDLLKLMIKEYESFIKLRSTPAAYCYALYYYQHLCAQLIFQKRWDEAQTYIEKAEKLILGAMKVANAKQQKHHAAHQAMAQGSTKMILETVSGIKKQAEQIKQHQLNLAKERQRINTLSAINNHTAATATIKKSDVKSSSFTSTPIVPNTAPAKQLEPVADTEKQSTPTTPEAPSKTPTTKVNIQSTTSASRPKSRVPKEQRQKRRDKNYKLAKELVEAKELEKKTKKLERDQAAAAKAEEIRIAQELADKQAKVEKDAEERIAKELAEKIAKETEEKRMAKEADNKLAEATKVAEAKRIADEETRKVIHATATPITIATPLTDSHEQKPKLLPLTSTSNISASIMPKQYQSDQKSATTTTTQPNNTATVIELQQPVTYIYPIQTPTIYPNQLLFVNQTLTNHVVNISSLNPGCYALVPMVPTPQPQIYPAAAAPSNMHANMFYHQQNHKQSGNHPHRKSRRKYRG